MILLAPLWAQEVALEGEEFELAKASYEKAVESCDLDSWEAVDCIENIAYEGSGQGAPQLMRYARLECDQEQATACHILAQLYYYEYQLPDENIEDYLGFVEKSYEIARENCERGFTLSCALEGEILTYDYEDPEGGLEKNKNACEDGSALGCSQAANYYFYDDASDGETYKKGLDILEEACGRALALSCSELSNEFLYPDGIEIQWDDFWRTGKRACDLGDAYSCYEIGVNAQNYAFAKGEEYDEETALFYMEKACEADEPDYNACEFIENRQARADQSEEEIFE